MISRSIYIHIPFCKKRCSYCDFCTGIDRNLEDRYINTLIEEFDLYPDSFKNVSTIYIGGGTPSSISYENTKKLLLEINKRLSTKVEEFTFEVNPESVDEKKLRLLREFGVDRISMGIQSLDDSTLNILGRIHSSKLAIDKLELIRKYFKRVNVDFIYGIDGIDFDIKEIFSKIGEIEHMSFYPLEIYEHLPIAKITKYNEDKQSEEYFRICSYLKYMGYEHYEVSNFAKNNQYSKHNLNYWRSREYYGFGLSSSGYISNTRYTNTGNIDRYLELVQKKLKPIEFSELIDDNSKFEEYIMLSLRCLDGINLDYLRDKFGLEIDREYIKENIDLENFIPTENGFKLSDKAMFLINIFILDIIERVIQTR